MSEGEGQLAFGPRNPFTAGATVTEAARRGTRLPGQHRGDRLLPVLLGGWSSSTIPPFCRRVRLRREMKKTISPGAEKWPEA